MSISHKTRAAIASLPGKTVKPWRDGDKRCHCTHCDLCGDLFPSGSISAHEVECEAALLKAIDAASAAPRDTMNQVELQLWIATFAASRTPDRLLELDHAAHWAAYAVFTLRGASPPTKSQVEALLNEARSRKGIL